MIYVLGQIWIWLLLALVLGIVLSWLWLRLNAANHAEEQLGPWRDRVSSLEHERDALRRDLGEARDRATESEAQLSALRDDLSEQEARIEALLRELDEFKSESSESEPRPSNGAEIVAGPSSPDAVVDLQREMDASGTSQAAETDAPDRLSRIKGIGTSMEKKLNAMGITTYAQIAALTKDEVARIDEAIGFKGRIERDDWIGQARKLLPET